MRVSVSFHLNDEPVTLDVDPARQLLWVLRTELAKTGTKYGCGVGLCGACTVLIDGKAVRSCTVPIKTVAGKRITTIEGLVQNGQLHPLQEAFMAHDALQCGFCTSGMILTAHDLLRHNPDPTKEEIIQAMNSNLCRCGAHPRIIAAIQEAAATKGVR